MEANDQLLEWIGQLILNLMQIENYSNHLISNTVGLKHIVMNELSMNDQWQKW